MKKIIWFDFANSPQVKFFANIIRELQKDHEVIITCRPLANTIELLDLEGFSYFIVGKHYGVNKFRKIIGIFRRVFLLWNFIRKRKIDIGVSHSSFYQPIVSWILRKKSIYINDNEHAAWNKLSIWLSTVAMFPEPLKDVIDDLNWNKIGKVVIYPGIKEGVYLWNYKQNIVLNKRKQIYIRTEPWNADYYSGRLNFIDDLILNLTEKYDVNILPRGEEPIKHYSATKFNKVNVLKNSIPQYDIFNNCDLFIGAGGSMTREAASVGIPTVSIYQDSLLKVDEYLIKCNAMIHEPDPTLALIEKVFEERDKTKPFKEILETGFKAHLLIKRYILE